MNVDPAASMMTSRPASNIIFARIKRRLSASAIFLLCLLWALAGEAVVDDNHPASKVISQGTAGERLSLTLDEAVNRALRFNRTLKDSEYAVENSKLGLGAAHDVFDVKIRPLSSINYSGGEGNEVTVWEVGGLVSKKFSTGIRMELKPSVAFGNDEYDAGVGFALAVPLLRGFGKDVVLNDVYSSEYAYVSALRNVHRQRVDTMLGTVSAVYSFVREQQLIKLYQEQIEGLAGHLKLASVKEQVGLARSMDVYRVEIRIKEVEDSLNLAKERLENASDQLKSILALPLGQDLIVKAPLSYSFITIDLNEAITAALAKRIEIKQGKADIDEARRRSQVASLNLKPDLELQAAYTRRGRASELDRSFIFDEDVFTIGLSSDTDLARSAEKTRWEQSRIALNREELQFTTTKETITREIRSVLNALAKSEERIQLRRQQIAQATGKQRLSQVKFLHGKADNFDLIESQAEIQRAKANLVADEIQYIVNGYRLRGAMGTLLEYNGN